MNLVLYKVYNRKGRFLAKEQNILAYIGFWF